MRTEGEGVASGSGQAQVVGRAGRAGPGRWRAYERRDARRNGHLEVALEAEQRRHDRLQVRDALVHVPFLHARSTIRAMTGCSKSRSICSALLITQSGLGRRGAKDAAATRLD